MKVYIKKYKKHLSICKRSIINGYNIVIYGINNSQIFYIIDLLTNLLSKYNYNVAYHKQNESSLDFEHRIVRSKAIYGKIIIPITNLAKIKTTMDRHSLLYINMSY